MYPDLQVLLEHVTRTNVPSFFSYFKTFGIFAALAFLVAAYVLKKELLRKEMNGLFKLWRLLGGSFTTLYRKKHSHILRSSSINWENRCGEKQV